MPKSNTTDTTKVEEKVDVVTAEADVVGETTAEGEEEVTTKKDTDNTTDYKSELAKEQARGKKPDPKVAVQAFKERDQKRKENGEEVIEDEDDRPLTRKEIKELFAAQRQESLRAIESQRISSIVKGLTSSEDEASLIIEIHKNRTFPSSLTLEEQIEESYVIANRKKILGERAEMARALLGKDTVTKGASASAGGEGLTANEPKIAPSDAVVMKQSGFTFNTATKRYEKKMANGNTLIRDPKTKQVQLIRKQ